MNLDSRIDPKVACQDLEQEDNTPCYTEEEDDIYSDEDDDNVKISISMLYETNHSEVLEESILREYQDSDFESNGPKEHNLMSEFQVDDVSCTFRENLLCLELNENSLEISQNISFKESKNKDQTETSCNPVFPKDQDLSIELVREQILEELKPISVNSLKDLKSTTQTVTHTIKLKPGAVPLKQKERRIAHHYAKEFEEIIDDMVESKKIQPTHTSPWASHLRLLRKKDKTIRVTVDYQYLNSCTERVAYPFPFADVIFCQLAMAIFFTVIDLTSGYYQVPLDPNCRSFTAFMCSKGCYEYLVLPMGLTNAVETFQRLMNEVLKGLIGVICQVYLDDIIIYSLTLEDHIKHVKIVVDRLKQHNLKIKLSKCKIAQTKIEYLSHVISYGSIQPSPNKVKDLLKYVAPLSKKQIHSFVGLASYYRKFIQGFANLIAPLIKAAHERILVWNNECQKAFDITRKLLISEPILKLPQFNLPFMLDTDASNYGIGGVLSQEQNNEIHPIAYFSKQLSKTERNYSTTERELLAIVATIEHFHQFLYGTQFVVNTDHQPLKYIFKIKEPAARLLRWMVRLSNYDFEIRYKRGIANGNADALSRLPEESSDLEESNETIIINFIIADVDSLNDDQTTDPDLKWLYDLKVQAYQENKNHIILKEFANHTRRSLYAQWNRIKIINGTLYRAWTIKNQNKYQLIFQYIVPNHQRLKILQLSHDHKASCHLGVEKTANRIKERFYWPNWESEVRQYVVSCEICQKIKAPSINRITTLQPILPQRPLQIITTDCMGPLPKSTSGNEYVLVIIDHFTKLVELFPLRHIKASNVAKSLLKFVCRHGIPEQILSDRGTNYQSELIENLCGLLDIHKTQTAAYHPQADGLSERFMRPLKDMISAYISENQRDWDKNIDLIAFAYNTAVHSTTKYSPYYLLYGRIPKIPLDILSADISIDLGLTEQDYVNNLQNKLESAFQIVIQNRDYRMNLAEIRHNRFVRAAKFNINDQVWVQVKQTKKGQNKKLSWKWTGPYIIINAFGDSTYIVKPLNKRGRKITVHQDRLKKNFMRPNKFKEPENTLIKKEDQTQTVVNPSDLASNIQNNDVTQNSQDINVIRRSTRSRQQPDRYQANQKK